MFLLAIFAAVGAYFSVLGGVQHVLRNFSVWVVVTVVVGVWINRSGRPLARYLLVFDQFGLFVWGVYCRNYALLLGGRPGASCPGPSPFACTCFCSRGGEGSAPAPC